MSQKYKAYLDAAKRDAEPCARCGHPRGWHVGDKNCIARETNQCTCHEWVRKADE